MSPVARATAISNFGFNAIGALLFFPFLRPFAQEVVARARDPGLAVAWAHLLFNLTIAIGFLATMDWVEPWLRRRLSVPDAAALPTLPQA
jgi:Na+/phosphate symporter